MVAVVKCILAVLMRKVLERVGDGVREAEMLGEVGPGGAGAPVLVFVVVGC